MSKHQRLSEALKILEEELYPSATEVYILKERLSCRKCKNVVYGESVTCKLYGPVPEEFVNQGCDVWDQNGTMFDKWDNDGALINEVA